jgi:5-methylthioadenosine/S-adenosylhomocysteine deaminase
MNNVPGTIVTMMNPAHVRDVLIAGRVVYWKRQLVGWDIDRLLRQVEQARDRVLARINGRAKVGTLPKGDNSFSNPYRPNMLGSCCVKGQNPSAPEYVLRP